MVYIINCIKVCYSERMASVAKYIVWQKTTSVSLQKKMGVTEKE